MEKGMCFFSQFRLSCTLCHPLLTLASMIIGADLFGIPSLFGFLVALSIYV